MKKTIVDHIFFKEIFWSLRLVARSGVSEEVSQVLTFPFISLDLVECARAKVMIVLAVTCAPCTILFALSHSLVEALTVALLLIVTGTHYAPSHEALQADLTPKMMRGRITALWQVGKASSGALGTLLGGFLFQTVKPALPFYLFTAAELTAVLLLITIVKEPIRKEV